MPTFSNPERGDIDMQFIVELLWDYWLGELLPREEELS